MIIGLVGYARAGKNTAADGLKSYHQVSFAKALKEEVAEIMNEKGGFGLRIDFKKDEEAKIKYRPLLVAWGEARRQAYENYWIDRLFKQIGHDLYHCNYVVTDCRYRNEVQAIKAVGGKIIYIERPGYEAANDVEAQSIKEILDCDIIDHIMINDGTVEELKEKMNMFNQFYNNKWYNGER